MSRKRKAWEPLSVGNKYVGLDRTPVSKGSDDEERTTGLQTPHCSRTGFEDGDVSGGELSGNSESGVSASKSNILSPMNPNLLNVEDIDADNLAADFDESFTGIKRSSECKRWFTFLMFFFIFVFILTNLRLFNKVNKL